MKNLYKLFLVALTLHCSISYAELPTINLGVRNMYLSDTLGGHGNVLFFDITMQHINYLESGPFFYASGQYSLGFNPVIANGGTLSYKIISSELPPNKMPTIAHILGDRLYLPGPLPFPPQPVIDTSYPGTKIAKLRLTTTASSFANVPFKFKWKIEGDGGFVTKIFADIFGTLIQITNARYYIDSASLPQYPALIAPPENSVNNPININFAWQKYAGTVNYTLLVATDSAMNNVVYNDSLIYDTSKFVAGFNILSKYYWKIKARDSLNNFIESYFNRFTTVPFLFSPVNNSLNLLDPVKFTWNRVLNGIAKHELRISTDSLLSNIVFLDTNVIDTFRTVGLTGNQNYYWSIVTIDTLGNSLTSAIWKFNTAIQTVNLLSPPDNSVEMPSLINFVWNKPQSAIKYTLKISRDLHQNLLVFIDSTLTDTSKLVGGFTTNLTLYWSVTAKDSTHTVAMSDRWKFSTTRFLLSPTFGQIVLFNPVTFVWRQAPGATNYLLMAARDNQFANIVFHDSTITDTTKSLGNFLPATTYYWRVSAKNANGYFLFSPVWVFTMEGPVPIEISSFTSDVDRNNAALNWTTMSEVNNAVFEIERAKVVSDDQWIKVGSVAGSGTISSPVNYNFTDKNLLSGKYKYRLKQIDFNGNFEYFNLGNEVNIGIPDNFSLSQNYPNPFNPATKIDFDLPLDGRVKIVIYDLSGREVITLLNESKTAGYYSLNFNGANLSSGVYFYRLNVISNDVTKANYIMTKRMMLIK